MSPPGKAWVTLTNPMRIRKKLSAGSPWRQISWPGSKRTISTLSRNRRTKASLRPASSGTVRRWVSSARSR